MAWYVYAAHFVAGLFLANGVPHFVHGISGKKFQSPFASPPGVGESRPMVNVLWGLFNFVVGYVLLYGVGDFKQGLNSSLFMVLLGAIVTGVGLAFHFGKIHGK